MQFPLTRPLQILSGFTAKSTYRPELTCVKVSEGYAEATDSYSFMRLSPALGKSYLPKDSEASVLIDLQKIKIKLPKDGTTVTMEVPTEDVERFPNVDPIFPKTEPVASITLNADYLVRVCNAVSELKKGSAHPDMTLEIHGSGQPCVLKAKTSDGTDILALVMPIRQ